MGFSNRTLPEQRQEGGVVRVLLEDNAYDRTFHATVSTVLRIFYLTIQNLPCPDTIILHFLVDAKNLDWKTW